MAYNNGLPRKPKQPRIQCTCIVCGAAFTTVPSRIPLGGGKVCSVACRIASLRRPLEDTFWPKVNKAGPVPAHQPHLGPCWVWIGKRHRNGYGQVGARPSTTGGDRLAHRVSWRLEHGAIPDGMHVLHRCDNPACVNPAHLFLGTRSDNMQDCIAKGRWTNKPSKREATSAPPTALSYT